MRAADTFEGAPCIGRWWLFDSTWPADHREAKKLCDTCPALIACRALLREEQAIAKTLLLAGGGPRGTWAGRLVGKSDQRARKVTA
jgi:hypothetical protein